jgi:Spy/CpxP family protein refolding chaperone
MDRKWLSAIFATLVLLGVGPLSLRAQMDPVFITHGPPPLGMLLVGVILTPEQQAEVKTIMQSHRQAIEPLRQQLDTQREQLMTRLTSPGQVSLADLTPLEQESAQTDAQLRQEMLKAAVEVRAVLTPDQLAKAAANQQKLAQIHGEMRDVMGPLPPPPDAP